MDTKDFLQKTVMKLDTLSLRTILVCIAGGIWMLVLQNLGIIPITQNVHIKGGNISSIESNVGVSGNVEVRGSVNVDNTVEVDLQAINGYSDVFFNNPRRGDEDRYYRIPVVAH